MKRILFVGGMSGGHIAPLIAVWRAVEKKEPVAQAHFVCSMRDGDAEFLRREGAEFSQLPAPRLSLMFPFTFLQSFLRARKIIASFRPDVVFSKGGALSVPVCLAARLAGVPIVLHESDAVSGRANAIVARWAKAICDGFPSEEKMKVESGKWKENDQFSILHSPFSMFTGNPIRKEIMQGSKERGCKITGFTGKRPVLLVLGGSQGSETLNAAVAQNLDAMLEICDIAHLTGANKGSITPRPGYWARPFVRDELPDLYAIATLALSRAGAGTISELAANGIPTILVPLRHVGHDHQEANARAVERSGACVILEQEDLHQALPTTVAGLLKDDRRRKTLSEKLHALWQPDAAEKIAEVLMRT